MRFFVGSFIILLMLGCVGLHTERLQSLNAKIDTASILLTKAQKAGDLERVLAIQVDLEALRKEREEVRKFAGEETNNKQLLLLTILGIVTGSLKLAADKFKKAVI